MSQLCKWHHLCQLRKQSYLNTGHLLHFTNKLVVCPLPCFSAETPLSCSIHLQRGFHCSPTSENLPLFSSRRIAVLIEWDLRHNMELILSENAVCGNSPGHQRAMSTLASVESLSIPLVRTLSPFIVTPVESVIVFLQPNRSKHMLSRFPANSRCKRLFSRRISDVSNVRGELPRWCPVWEVGFFRYGLICCFLSVDGRIYNEVSKQESWSIILLKTWTKSHDDSSLGRSIVRFQTPESGNLTLKNWLSWSLFSTDSQD